MLPESEIGHVLAVAAHPDDIDFGAAGTIAAFTAAGVPVSYLIATAGDAGGFDPAVPREQIPQIRRAEQLAAAEQVGVHDVRFLDYRDGRVEVTQALRRDIARVIRQVRPDLAIIPTPERNYRNIGPSHPDHRAVGAAALDAIYPDARNPFAHPELLREEGLEPWTVREAWLSGGDVADHYVDITATFDRKVEALRAHRSQTAEIDDLPGMLRGWLGAAAQAAGLPDGHLAESFRVVSTG